MVSPIATIAAIGKQGASFNPLQDRVQNLASLNDVAIAMDATDKASKVVKANDTPEESFTKVLNRKKSQEQKKEVDSNPNRIGKNVQSEISVKHKENYKGQDNNKNKDNSFLDSGNKIILPSEQKNAEKENKQGKIVDIEELDTKVDSSEARDAAIGQLQDSVQIEEAEGFTAYDITSRQTNSFELSENSTLQQVITDESLTDGILHSTVESGDNTTNNNTITASNLANETSTLYTNATNTQAKASSANKTVILTKSLANAIDKNPLILNEFSDDSDELKFNPNNTPQLPDNSVIRQIAQLVNEEKAIIEEPEQVIRNLDLSVANSSDNITTLGSNSDIANENIALGTIVADALKQGKQDTIHKNIPALGSTKTNNNENNSAILNNAITSTASVDANQASSNNTNAQYHGVQGLAGSSSSPDSLSDIQVETQAPDRHILQSEINNNTSAFGLASDKPGSGNGQVDFNKYQNYLKIAQKSSGSEQRAIKVNDIMAQIKFGGAELAAKGEKHISIQLYPKELGSVDVSLKTSHDGKTTVTVIAEKADTLNLLQKEAHLLKDALQDALKTESSQLSFAFKEQSFAGHNQQNNNFAFGKTAIGASKEEEVPSAIAAYDLGNFMPEDGINILI